ncbi:hypothetical protein HYC85_004160 [Camellia sinensis]|uniref:Pentacotripeptide-repeat region of PRORP domain-containing protein n=1 Tax=Camellia sinensis TaxID=4442 RepID=A0A7J7HWQ1_CAMSI|nr:hypothetical protein HYC85_004160 [Camellia sinensis]
MLQTDKESLPDDESYDLVIGMLLLTDQIDATLKYIDLTLKSRYILSVNVFTECVRNCVNKGRLDTLVSIIERCKKMDQNKALCPPRNLCNYIADVAMEEDSSETNNAKLLDGSWVILKRALRQKKVPNPESYLAMIYAHASLGNLQKAFSTLHEFETTYRNSTKEAEEDLLSPFTSLCPLVMACSKDGFVTLDSTSEASSVFDHLISKGVKPNSTTYSLFVNTHLIKREQKAALSVINETVNSGFEPSREMLKKVRR